MKEEGTDSKAPLTEAFADWKNLKIVLLALFGLTAGQAVVWYTGQFYALFFLTRRLKVDGATANIMIAVALLIGTPFFIVFGWLSDRIGRKPIIMAGCLLAALTYFPLFQALTHAANPALAAAAASAPGRRSSPIRPTARSSSTRSAQSKFTSRLRHRQGDAGRARSVYYNEPGRAGRRDGAGQDRRRRGARRSSPRPAPGRRRKRARPRAFKRRSPRGARTAPAIPRRPMPSAIDSADWWRWSRCSP